MKRNSEAQVSRSKFLNEQIRSDIYNHTSAQKINKERFLKMNTKNALEVSTDENHKAD